MSKVRFQDIVKPKEGFLRGPFGGDLKKDIFVQKSSDTYKVYEQGVVLNNDESIGRYYISNEYFEQKMYKFEVKPKDFLVSCSGVNYGAIHQLSEEIEPGVINQALLRIRLDPQKIDDNYFYYLFKALIVNMIVGKKGDSTIPNFPPLGVIKDLQFELPEMDYQIKVGSFLKSLDKKIEINNRINAELEAMAKTLYDYWFVQFDFPDANGNPYKTSGGKMVYDPTLECEIPEGWSAIRLFDAMDAQYGFPFDTSKFIDNPSGYAIARIRDVLENTISCYTTEEVDQKYLLKPNDLLIAMDGNFHINFWSKSDVYLNQRTVRLRDKSNSLISVFQCYFELSPYIKAREKNVSRTTVGHLSDKDLKRLYLLSPDPSKSFNPKTLFDSLLNKMMLNRVENKTLSSLRDWLLPMLMNGQVTVKG